MQKNEIQSLGSTLFDIHQLFQSIGILLEKQMAVEEFQKTSEAIWFKWPVGILEEVVIQELLTFAREYFRTTVCQKATATEISTFYNYCNQLQSSSPVES